MDKQVETKGTILYVGGFELPDGNAAANRVLSNGKLFAKLGYRVAYLGMAPEKDSFEGVREVSCGTDMYEEAHPSGTVAWMTHLFSTKHLKEVMGRYPDLAMVVVYNVPFCTLKRVKSLCRKQDIPVVYDCTEWSADTDGSLPKRLFKKWDERYIRTKIGRVSDGLIVISRRMERQYAADAKPMLRLPPLVDVNDSMWHQEIERQAGCFEFCFAGGLDGNKESLDRIVEAFRRLDAPTARLRIVGVSEDAFYAHYTQVPRTADDRITFMGRLPHRETIRYVLGCDCYIFVRTPDRRNNAGFPTKFAESYTCGVPILTTNVSDLGDYVAGMGRGEMLQSTEADVILAAMERQIRAAIPEAERSLDRSFHYETYLEKTEAWLAAMLSQ